MPEKINEENLIKDAIVNAPEVTEVHENKVEEKTPAPEKKKRGRPKKIAKTEIKPEIKNNNQTYYEQDPEKRARLLSASVNDFTRSLSGKELNKERLEAVSELSLELFRSIYLPKWAHLSLLGFAVALPFIPSLLKTYRAFSSEKEKEPDFIQATQRGNA